MCKPNAVAGSDGNSSFFGVRTTSFMHSANYDGEERLDGTGNIVREKFRRLRNIPDDKDDLGDDVGDADDRNAEPSITCPVVVHARE